jgi:hypothetical protein
MSFVETSGNDFDDTEHNNEAEIITDEEVSLRIVSSLFAPLYWFFSYNKNFFELTFDLMGSFL